MSKDEDSNLNQVMTAKEQAEILQDAILGHHYALMDQIRTQIETIQSSQGGLTPEIAEFFTKALEAERQWLASHGIYFPSTPGGAQ